MVVPPELRRAEALVQVREQEPVRFEPQACIARSRATPSKASSARSQVASSPASTAGLASISDPRAAARRTMRSRLDSDCFIRSGA